MEKLINKVAVIADGSSSLATAQEFANHGAKIVIFGRGKEAGNVHQLHCGEC